MCRMSPFWDVWGQYHREWDHWSDYDLGHKVCVTALWAVWVWGLRTLCRAGAHLMSLSIFFPLAFPLARPLTLCPLDSPSCRYMCGTLILFVSRPLHCFVVYVKSVRSLSRFFFKFIYLLFIYFWLCWVFTAARGLSLVAASGATLCCGAQASYCGGFYCCEARALGTWASVVVACGLSSCGSGA